MTTTQDIFVDGLRNAHAMENQALSIMKPQLSRIENYPEVRQMLERHIAETEGQIQRLEQVLDDLGESKSALKDFGLSVAGTMASLGHTVAPDEIVKNSFANFAFENFEIAAYKSLIALATQSNNTRAVELLEMNLDEELAMADWLDQNIEAVTLQYAALREAGEQAKR
ncbi:ferritin-like domain-containing protein [Devosia rhizoryzae]|uniref:Ferritin-like domain-containing protein n=1 Tax=Devosia rhizoryzae TaxID=2774137 RepID=A0ABX7C3J7_9HYPH|nr:ferritin-like domain-containing protein [Devosia rhizoryzae]QQR38661.1 ferritin-like domain-containing protein [Devosia rhizoryzae]